MQRIQYVSIWKFNKQKKKNVDYLQVWLLKAILAYSQHIYIYIYIFFFFWSKFKRLKKTKTKTKFLDIITRASFFFLVETQG